MPIINIDITPQKKEIKEMMIKKVTDELSEITQIEKEFFRIIINEVEPENIGIGGNTLLKLREDGDK
ncbi:4-oxalocrotonate tautomerase [Clostridium algifaecis]|uniref:4-oxalocrotonate tautomerase n=1 Tax=Clostridium algifaecis TaxID=1472040 RepID=A0ABS4KV23_9CLOT|nr:tautomerase family protein [Clostridium algifaecis]MBP2033455.1 4-oxalocrotonate tautomerase [Clostridium algifaecis]